MEIIDSLSPTKVLNRLRQEVLHNDMDNAEVLYELANEYNECKDFNHVTKLYTEGAYGINNTGWIRHIDEISEELDIMINNTDVDDGVITCNNCKSKKVKTDSKQIRSGDEGMTVFCVCTICHKKWTING